MRGRPLADLAAAPLVAAHSVEVVGEGGAPLALLVEGGDEILAGILADGEEVEAVVLEVDGLIRVQHDDGPRGFADCWAPGRHLDAVNGFPPPSLDVLRVRERCEKEGKL